MVEHDFRVHLFLRKCGDIALELSEKYSIENLCAPDLTKFVLPIIKLDGVGPVDRRPSTD